MGLNTYTTLYYTNKEVDNLIFHELDFIQPTKYLFTLLQNLYFSPLIYMIIIIPLILIAFNHFFRQLYGSSQNWCETFISSLMYYRLNW